jgi:hypothetical protein
VVQVIIKQSKTDPFRQGVNLYLGKRGEKLCPVSAIYGFGGQVQALFLCFRTGHILPDDMVAKVLHQAGLNDQHYSTHSFRIGAATSAKDAGISDAHIKMLGRWRSEAYQLYVRTPKEQLAKLSKQLASSSD